MSKADFILQIPLQLHASPHNLTIIPTLIDSYTDAVLSLQAIRSPCALVHPSQHSPSFLTEWIPSGLSSASPLWIFLNFLASISVSGKFGRT